MAFGAVEPRGKTFLPTIFEEPEQELAAQAGSAAPGPPTATGKAATTRQEVDHRAPPPDPDGASSAFSNEKKRNGKERKASQFATVRNMFLNTMGLKRIESIKPAKATTAPKYKKIILSVPAIDERFLHRRRVEQRYAAHFLQHVTDAAWDALEADRQQPPPHATFVEPELTKFRFGNIRLVARTALQDVIRTVKEGAVQYLHANAVNIAGAARFIASQKPTRFEQPGFMQMLRSERVALILDLTKPEENPDNDADPSYCPARAGEKRTVDPKGKNIVVSCSSVLDYHQAPATAQHHAIPWGPGELIEQELQIGRGLYRHTLQRLHFSGWPDQGTISEERLIALADKVEAMTDQGTRLTLIHCLAGIGRTGTLMSFIAARKLIAGTLVERSSFCDHAAIVETVHAIVAQGRRDRGPGFVQTGAQFRLIVMALTQTFAHRMPSEIGLEKMFTSVGDQRWGRQPTVNGSRVKVQATPRAAPLAAPEAPPRTEPDNGGYIDPGLVGANTKDIVCPRKTAIQVWLNNASSAHHPFIHANAIRYPKKNLFDTPGVVGSDSARIIAAGQSPQQFRLCERFLLQGLDSGKGLLQFVSPNTHHNPRLSSEKPIVGQLQEQMRAAAGAGRDLILGGRFKVTGLDELHDPADPASDYARFRLTVTDVDHPTQTRTAILTQAGLKFDDNLLDVREIERANTLAKAHDCLNPASAMVGQSGPMVVSYSGIGRNATLIVYQEALARFKDVGNPHELDALIDRIVAIGRRDRGPHFVHSDQQLSTLRQAVHQAYARQTSTAGAS